MSGLLSHEWRDLNARLHADNPAFGASGHKWQARIERIASTFGCRSALDYGCGKATLDLPGMVMSRYDPAVSRHATPPSPADLVVCTDTLEHVEPEQLSSVLAHLRGLTLKAIFMVISTRPSDKTMPDGRNAHLSIEPMAWWMPQIEQRWRVVEAYDSGERQHWAHRRLKKPPLEPGREFSVTAVPC